MIQNKAMKNLLWPSKAALFWARALHPHWIAITWGPFWPLLLPSGYSRFLCSCGRAAQRQFKYFQRDFFFSPHLPSSQLVELISSARKSWTVLAQVLRLFSQSSVTYNKYTQIEQGVLSLWDNQTWEHWHCRLHMRYSTLRRKTGRKWPSYKCPNPPFLTAISLRKQVCSKQYTLLSPVSGSLCSRYWVNEFEGQLSRRHHTN